MKKTLLFLTLIFVQVLAFAQSKNAFPAWMDDAVFERKNSTAVSGPVDPETGLNTEFGTSVFRKKVHSKLPDFQKMRQKSIKSATESHISVDDKLKQLFEHKTDIEKNILNVSDETQKIPFLELLKNLESQIKYLESVKTASDTKKLK